MLKNFKRLVLAACCGVLFTHAPANAADIVLRFAHEAPETAIKGQSANKLAELVEKYTDGSVKIQVFPGGQLIPTTDEIRAVARGQVDIVAPYTSYFSAIDPAWDVFYQPMLFPDPQTAMTVFSGPVGQELLGRLSSRGMTGLSVWHDGPIYVFGKGKPILTPSDMENLKIRVAPSRPIELALSAAKATAVAIPATEVYLALQQGVANAVITTSTYVGPAKWNEVLSTGTRVMFGMGGYGLVVNTKSMEKMDDKQRAGFMKAVGETEQWNQDQATMEIKRWETYLAENGLKWYEVNAEQKAQWQAIADQVEAAQNPDAKALVEKIRK